MTAGSAAARAGYSCGHLRQNGLSMRLRLRLFRLLRKTATIHSRFAKNPMQNDGRPNPPEKSKQQDSASITPSVSVIIAVYVSPCYMSQCGGVRNCEFS